jgi:hypothetical protein
MSSLSSADSSLLLWLMAALVALLASYLFVGWIRRAQLGTGPREWLGPVTLAGASLGVGMASAMALALSAEGVAFALGYRWLALPFLVLGPMLACMPVAWWLSRRQNALALIGGGLVLAAIAVAVQCGWITAAGLRPGVRWQPAWLGVAAGIAAVGHAAALWLAYSDASSDGARKTLWRVGAAALMALTMVAGQEVVSSSAGLLSQVGSIYLREAGATWVSLVAGALVPTVLGMMAFDLTLRNRADRYRRRRGSPELNLQPRRKRRRKYRPI